MWWSSSWIRRIAIIVYRKIVWSGNLIINRKLIERRNYNNIAWIKSFIIKLINSKAIRGKPKIKKIYYRFDKASKSLRTIIKTKNREKYHRSKSHQQKYHGNSNIFNEIAIVAT